MLMYGVSGLLRRSRSMDLHLLAMTTRGVPPIDNKNGQYSCRVTYKFNTISYVRKEI